MADGDVFRRAAREHLASPEQLDGLLRIDDARGWVALIGCGVLIASAFVWGVFGSVPTKLQASGILIYSAGLADVMSVAVGQITALDVRVGDSVRKGQIIARLAQPGLQQELSGLQNQRRELQAANEKSRQLESQDVQLRAAATAHTRAALLAGIAAARQRERELAQRLEAQQRLHDKGLVTRELLLNTQDALSTTQASLRSMNTELQQVEVSRLSVTRANEVERRDNEAKLADTDRQIRLIEQRLEQNSRVASAYDGRVVELRAMLGDVLEPGQTIVSIERTAAESGLEALLYVDSREGKRIKPGMSIELSPSMARRERYGVIRAWVRSIEAFPSTRQGMVRMLHNEQLVDDLLVETKRAPIAVRAELQPDRTAASGYRWSSRRGAALKLSSGTRCTAAIVTGMQRPISLLFPTVEAVM